MTVSSKGKSSYECSTCEWCWSPALVIVYSCTCVYCTVYSAGRSLYGRGGGGGGAAGGGVQGREGGRTCWDVARTPEHARSCHPHLYTAATCSPHTGCTQHTCLVTTTTMCGMQLCGPDMPCSSASPGPCRAVMRVKTKRCRGKRPLMS